MYLSDLIPGDFFGKFGGDIAKIGMRKAHDGAKGRNFYQDITIQDGDGEVIVTLINRAEVREKARGRFLEATSPDGQHAKIKISSDEYGVKAKAYKGAGITIDGHEVGAGEESSGPPKRQGNQGGQNRSQGQQRQPAKPQGPALDRDAFEEHLRACQDIAIDLRKRAEDRLGRKIEGADTSILTANQIVMSSRDNGLVLKLASDRGAPARSEPEDRGTTDANSNPVDDDDIPF